MIQRKYSVLILDYLGIVVGSLLTAAGLVLFLIPNQIAAGGISGAAIVLHHLFGFRVGASILVLNIPLFIISIRLLGVRFVLRTLLGIFLLAVGTDFLQLVLPVITREPLLAALYGGGVAGLGLGLVIRSGATTGGTDILARIINRFMGFSVGQSLFLVDFVVITAAGFVFGADMALYALIALFVTGKVIDFVQQGLSPAKAAIIVSDHPAKITSRVINELERGVTLLEGRGGYSARDRELLLVVVSRSELSRLKRLVHETDRRAFVIITQVHEVLGEGFGPMIPD